MTEAERNSIHAVEDRDLSRRAFLVRSGQFGATATLGGVLAACGSKAATTTNAGARGKVRSGGTLLAAIGSEPDTLDPQKSSLYAAEEVFDNIFSKLLSVDPHGNYVPRLATDWHMQDARTWVFNLRPDVQFHNGDKFTAADVKYTYERLLNPKTAASIATKYTSLAGVTVVSPTQVAFQLKAPFGPLLTTLAGRGGEIVNQRAIEASDSARSPVGTGPFKFVDWVRADHVDLTRYPRYFETGLPHLDALKLSWPQVSAQRVNDLVAGQLNWVDQVPAQLLPGVQSNPSLRVATSDNAGLPQFLTFNCSKPPLNNLALRQAIAWAVNRQQIRQVAFFGLGQTGSEEVPTGSPWYSHNDPYLAGPDMAKAKAYMRQSGLKSVDITFAAWTAAPYPTAIGELLKQQLAPLGINIHVQQQELSTWITNFIGKNYELTIAFNEGTVDPNDWYALIVSTSSQNTTGYVNKSFDALVAQAAATYDMTQRQRLYAQVRQIVFNEVPVFYLHYATEDYAMQKTVLDSAVRPNLELGLQYVGFAA